VGTSARVFMAVDTQLRRRVAVKLLHEALASEDAFLRRFRAEARAAGALSHPNIVQVYDWGEDVTDDGIVPYLVTEYLGGGSLRGILDRGTLSASQTLIVGLDASQALAHAHRRGLIHRDVKPGNLLFDEDGLLRLADFGLARALAEASWTEPNGSSVGTARYASPEQALGRRLDGRSDVYSLAMVLVECLTGTVPFTGDTTASTLVLRTQGDLELDPALGALRGPLERAGRLDPDERPDADELGIALMAAAESLPRPAPLPLVPTRGETQVTSELLLVEGPSEPVPVALDADPGAADPGAADPGEAGQDGADRSDPPAVDPGDTGPLLRTPIVVAEEHSLLASSRPATFGRVEPLDRPLGPAAATLTPDDEPPPRNRRRRRILVLALVAALLAGATAAWWVWVRVPVHEVPDLVGEDIGDVRARADELGWEVDADTLVRRDDTRAGEVVEQSPPPGDGLAEGDTLTLTVSLGPTLVPPPAVAGQPEAQARQALEAAGLVVGAVTGANDEQVPAGAVVSAAPAPGQEAPDATGQVPKGTRVDLVVSDGPAPRTVPDGLAGVPVADARARLEAVQLQASVSEQFDEAVPAGTVLSAGVPAGTQLDRGTAVPLVVSKGPAPVPVPNVVGQSGTAAAATLQASGFAVSGIEGSPSGAVLATDPPAGELHQRGTAVRIFTRS
jgi:serine/threonine-protein kinase